MELLLDICSIQNDSLEEELKGFSSRLSIELNYSYQPLTPPPIIHWIKFDVSPRSEDTHKSVVERVDLFDSSRGTLQKP